MKELKFRAWDKVGKCWLQNGLLQDFLAIGVPDEPIDGIFDIFQWSKARLEITQYTGLKDKNSKEIYEHDILRGDVREWKEYPVFVVQWEQPLTRFTLVRPNGNDGFWGLEMTDKYSKGSVEHLEVIGNIYEHKKLLK